MNQFFQNRSRCHYYTVASLVGLMWVCGCVEDVNLVDTGTFESNMSGSVDSVVRREPIRPLESPVGLPDDKVQLGKLLFHDVRLSHDNTISCASCHNVSEGGDDGKTVSTGINSQVGRLNAPTVLNSSLSIAQFWDGRANTLSEQAAGPIHNPIEMGSSWNEIVQKLEQDPDLRRLFESVFNRAISAETIVEAIVCYETALITVDSPFDLYLKGDDNAISADAKEGFKLFKSVGCISCHQGRTVGGNMFQEFGVLGDFEDHFDSTAGSNKGRFNVTRREDDLRRFKVPSLRNVEKTTPYFHTGGVDDLSKAIEIMAEYQLGESLREIEVKYIRQFLISLGGEIKKELQ